MKMFGERNAPKHEYQPIIRVGEADVDNNDEDEEDNVHDAPEPNNKRRYWETTPPFRPQYAKLKLDLAYETGEPMFRLFD